MDDDLTRVRDREACQLDESGSPTLMVDVHGVDQVCGCAAGTDPLEVSPHRRERSRHLLFGGRKDLGAHAGNHGP